MSDSHLCSLNSLPLPGSGPVTEGHFSQKVLQAKSRVFAYYDGSNFYHRCKAAYGVAHVDFRIMAEQMLNKEEVLVQVQFHTARVNQQQAPLAYRRQQRFLMMVQRNPLVQVRPGRLVKRPLAAAHVECPQCGLREATDLRCPTCGRSIPIRHCYKLAEKGVDVRLAMSMLLDAVDNKFDAALLFSNDADYAPAIRYIVGKLRKSIIYCRFPGRATNELLQVCSGSRLITRQAVEAAHPA